MEENIKLLPKLNISQFITSSITILTIVFGIGQLYGEYIYVKSELESLEQLHQKDIEILDRRLEKKIKLIEDLEQKIINIEKHLEFEKGQQLFDK